MVSTLIHANPGPAYWPTGWWRPAPGAKLVYFGKFQDTHRSDNPRAWDQSVTWAARLFVGLNVGNRKRWKIGDVVSRVARHYGRGASFVAQKGLWPSEKGGRLVVEDSVQVILVNVGKDPRAFKAEVEALAEKLVVSLRQEFLVLEFQRNGLVKQTLGIKP